MKEKDIKKIISQFIKYSNAFDVEKVLTLFADKAIIDDVSGEKFRNMKGVRNYIEKFFVGYKTVTRLESIETIGKLRAKAQVDFTGNFGHETGGLVFTLNTDGLITKISAHLD
jgi:ketosteroid isomerase-like protein